MFNTSQFFSLLAVKKKISQFENAISFWHIGGSEFRKIEYKYKAIGATKVARSSEISDRGRFVANLVYLLKIFPKNFFNIFKKECFL